jgi:hypothetical protein
MERESGLKILEKFDTENAQIPKEKYPYDISKPQTSDYSTRNFNIANRYPLDNLHNFQTLT